MNAPITHSHLKCGQVKSSLLKSAKTLPSWAHTHTHANLDRVGQCKRDPRVCDSTVLHRDNPCHSVILIIISFSSIFPRSACWLVVGCLVAWQNNSFLPFVGFVFSGCATPSTRMLCRLFWEYILSMLLVCPCLLVCVCVESSPRSN